MLKQLDIGVGGANRIRDGYDGYGVDVVANDRPWLKQNKVADLAIQPLPYKDNMFDLVTAYDVLEHIPKMIYGEFTDKNAPDGILHTDGSITKLDPPKRFTRRNCMIELFNEVYRVLKDGGEFYFVVPKAGTAQFISDPTHITEWCEDSVNYYSGDYFGMHDDYGHTSKFKKLLIQNESGFDWRMEVLLKAEKPATEPYTL